MTPKVSVIMGIYNGEKTMKRAIDSILEQTFTDWELIICDDCSIDNTFKIASEYAKKNSRIKVIKNEKNMRAAYSRNQCLKFALGKYIAVMDDDDICLPDRFEKQVEYLDEHPEMAAVASAAIVFDENGDKCIRGIGNPYPFANKDGNPFFMPFIHPTTMLRKSAYELLGGYRVSPETMRAEDLDLFYRFRAEKLDGYVIQEPLLRYCETTESLNKRTFKAAWGIVKVNKKYFKKLKISYKWYFYIYKPLVHAVLPRWIMLRYHKSR